jgi:predicted RNase H-like HicB family nuclease
MTEIDPAPHEVYTEQGEAEMSTYTVFLAPTATGYSAHVPDLPGCVAAARTLEETRQLIREAIEFHIEAMRVHGDVVPEPTPHIEQIEVSKHL